MKTLTNQKTIDTWWSRIKGCETKQRYETEEDAWCVAGHEALVHNKKLRIYHCQFCEGWHITKRLV